MAQATDVLIIGGGMIGMALAVELTLRGRTVTVLTRSTSEAAGFAAAGMLAPQAEEIHVPAMLELCLRSRELYADWVSKLEDLSDRPAGYWPCGILAPVYARPGATGDASPRATPDASRCPRHWLDQAAVQYAQPGLGPDVVGGWWYPEDGQVDNRALMACLQGAADVLGIRVQSGVTVTGLRQRQGRVDGVQTTAGEWHAQHYVLAAGAWSHDLLPIPVHPRKGQMLALQGADALEAPLRRVLFGEEIYIVPRQDGRIVVGATSESVGFQPGNTAAGVQALLQRATRLVPSLAALPIDELWWGFRPATPDELPVLGESPWNNLTLATGHYRNGVLLAPVTAALLAERIVDQTLDPLLSHFSWTRFSVAPGAIAPSVASRSSITHAHPLSESLSVQTLDPISNNPTSTASLDWSDSPLVIAGRTFRSRLMTGSGKYRNFDEMRGAIAASGCEIVTVAIRRVQTNAPGHEGLAEALDWRNIWMLPNTAGCKTAEEAVRVARLGREMAKLLGQEDNNFVKLEVIPDAKYLLPDPIGTLEAAEQLVKEGFAVLPYINADPLLAKRLEEAGCATVMPLGSPIGSGQGIRNAANIEIIIENASVPVVVDAGIGTPSEAAMAMEMGASALLINSAIALAQNPVLMARAMGQAAEAGRMAYMAGRIPVKSYAIASSPTTGTITE